MSTITPPSHTTATSSTSTSTPDTTPPTSNPNPNPNPPPSRQRRERPQLSCTTCRQKKLKCDRAQPCENCTARGRGHTCTYAHPPPPGQIRARARGRVGGQNSSVSAGVNGKSGLGMNAVTMTMQDRVKHLEKLVLALVREKGGDADGDGQGEVDGGKDSDAGLPIESIGSLYIQGGRGGGGSKYFDSGHWAAILSDIAAVKGYFFDGGSDEERESPDIIVAPETETEESEPDLFSGRFPKMGQVEILGHLPSRESVDRLVSRYFNSMDQSSVIIHRPSFRKEYEKFWEDPWSTPIMWVGMLFSILCISVRISCLSGDELPSTVADPDQLMDKYRQMAVHCLHLGNYSTAVPYTLEALILYFFTEFTRRPDAQVGCWLLFGMIVRIAMRRGYHRDSRHYSNISALEGEMRRRIWVTIYHLDLLTSVEAGLPRMIRPFQVDTELPRNLYDDDFDSTTTDLPPSRPDGENPAISYIISKTRLVDVFGMVVDLNGATQLPPYDEVLKLDKALVDNQRSIPHALQMHSMESSVTDPPFVIMRRFTLEFFFQKSRCILHRKFFNLAWNEAKYQYSRRTCVDAAMTTLRYQAILYRETQPGGLLRRLKWMVSSMTTHDFLLAAMIICLYLDRPPVEMDGTVESRTEMIQALQQSFVMLSDFAVQSKSAARACSVLKVILSKVGVGARDEGGPPASGPMAGLVSSYPVQTEPPIPVSYAQPDVYPLVPADSTTMPTQPDMGLVDPPQMMVGNLDIHSLIGDPQEVDWDLWDSIFRSRERNHEMDNPQLG